MSFDGGKAQATVREVGADADMGCALPRMMEGGLERVGGPQIGTLLRV